MKIIHQISNLITRHLRKFGLMQSLTFDQQVWGAKSVMDLVQFDSRFMLAEADAGILFCPPQNVIDEFPNFPVTRNYAELRTEIDKASASPPTA